jgi:hypothetical protein
LNTIEEHIIWLLHEKIQLFESVIGELETILEKIEGATAIEQNLMRLVLESADDAQIRKELSQWGDQFHMKKKEVEKQKEEEDVLLYGSKEG